MPPDSNVSLDDPHKVQRHEELRSLGRRIRQFGLSLPQVRSLDAGNSEQSVILTAHALSHMSMMFIHLLLADTRPSSDSKIVAVNSAFSHINEFITILEMLGNSSLGSSVVDPIMSVSRSRRLNLPPD